MRRVAPAALALIAVSLLRLAARPVADPDIWWHLRLGQDLSASGLRWSSVEHWSPFATEGWVPSAPLSDIVLSHVEDWFGLPGIAWLFGLALLAMLAAAYLCCRLVASDLPAVLATALLVAGASGSLTPRPQMLSFVLLPLVLCVWLRTEQDHVPRWWLVPLTWAWAMFHGYWFIGVLVGLTVAAGMTLTSLMAGGRLVTRESAKLLAVPVLAMGAAMLTPVGPELALAPFRVSERGQFVDEGMRTAFDRIQPWLVLAMILTVALVWSVKRSEASVARLGLLVMATGWLLITERTVAVAAILTAPLLASALQALITERSVDGPSATKLGVLKLAGLGGLGLVFLALVVPQTADQPDDVPAGLDSLLRDEPQHAIVLNEYTIGGWLAWKYPHLDVVVDPLADAYSVDYLRDYGEMVGARGAWRDFVANADPDLAVLISDDPIVDALKDADWEVEATDGVFVLLTPPEV